MKINSKKILLVLLSGALICLSFPKWNFWFLAWVALAPMFWSMEGLDFKRSFILGWLTGFVSFCGILYWIVPTFHAAKVSTTVGVLSVFLLSAYLGIYFGLFTGVSVIFKKKFPEFIWMFLLTALWVSLEYLRGHLFTGFPWGLMGYSQWKILSVIQISEWTGVYGVSAFLILANLFLFRQIKKVKTWDRISMASILCLLFLFSVNVLLFSNYKREQNQNPKLQVTILQGNINQYEKWSPEYVNEILSTYEKLSGKAVYAGNDKQARSLIVWPETSVPGWFPQEERLLKWVERNIKKTDSYNLIGSVTQSGGKNYNSAFLLDADGKILSRYDKMHLVPFGEYVPIQSLLGRWIEVLNELGGFDSGGSLKILEVPKAKLGVSICYEAIFPELIRRQALEGAEMLVNITNDGWYLDTAAPEQHFTMNIFRAVENRRYLIRSANTGISGIIKPDGSLQEISKLNQETILRGTIIPRAKKTFYTRFGDLFAWLCLVISITGVLFREQNKAT